MSKALLTLACFCFLALPAWASEELFLPQERAYLVQLYRQQGFDATYLELVFYSDELTKRPVAVEKNIYQTENPRDYSEFTNSYSLWVAKRFAKRWAHTLAEASQRYQVDEEVLVSILLVETGFGNVMGKYPVIGVFASILVAAEQNRLLYPLIDQMDEAQAYGLKRLQQKEQWALAELGALLTLAQAQGHSPCQYKGSYAGAFGLPQFLPSSYLKWGVDSDANGSVNLYDVPDALHSTAHYLKSHGWQAGQLRHQQSQEAVLAYNRSRPYLETVIKVAEILKDTKAKAVNVRAQATSPSLGSALAQNP